ncbi:beta-lactamase/transpeptidase-like protein [Pleomassaria siparia CBS 279.74]|uniref:Beta-lactamase/transpeptidase-like protein n=1 Tax=Pleomassaria siparia CBS 279.74 TaxID=1314801 RepID=A0A6G1JY33_9PLEO|nr:beta-lactamase/transpeptidase-like protein [Pleomassaria siparia CBS 279.74]
MMTSSHSFVRLFATALGISLFSTTSALPSSRQPARSALNLTTSDLIYYGVSGASHAERSEKLKADGLRVLSLDVSGIYPNEQYSAIWAPQESANSTVPFEIISAANSSAYESWLAEWTAKGYVSTHISASGPPSQAVFAGVVEQLPSVTSWVQQCEMTSPWSYENATKGVSMTIKGVTMYGVPKDRRYCILGHEKQGNAQQTVYYNTDTYTYNYEEILAAETQKRFWRPTFLDVSSDGLITTFFEDSSVGKWVAKVDLTEAQLAIETKTQAAQGLQPIHLQSSNTGVSARYAVIFAEHTTPLPRAWTVNGEITGFRNNSGATTTLDSTMKSFMALNGIRQAQVAVAVNGTVIGERAYTWAESDRTVITPDDQFLLASVSKMFTHAATWRLIQAGLVNLSTPIFPLIGVTPKDPRALNTTIYHLINHEGGWDRLNSPLGDVGFIFTTVGRSKNSSTPATLLDVIEYVAAAPLDFTPGTSVVYSNFGTMLLSYMVAKVTGVKYHDYLVENVLEGLKVDLYETSGLAHVDDRVVQETKYTGLDPVHPMSDAKVPAVYGGDGSIKEETIGAFSMKASASTLVKFVGSNAVYKIGERQAWASRDGSTAGARTYVESRAHVDWAVTLNSREYLSDDAWNQLIWWDIPAVMDFDINK